MTPEENVQLRAFGVSVMFDLMSDGLYALGYASFVWLYILTLKLLITHGIKSTAQKIMLGLANVLFLLCTLDIVTELWQSLLTSKEVMTSISESSPPLETRIKIADKLIQPLTFVEDSSLRIIVLIGDVTVVWRAWVMWPSSRSVRLSLLIAMVASIALNLVYLIKGVTVIYDLVGCLSSFAVNVFGTGLVFRKAWLHQKSMAIPRKKTDVQRMLALIVESGSIYGFLQLAYLSVLIILSQLPTPLLSNPVILVLKMVAKVIADFSPAAYPLAVIVIIRLRRSIVDQTVQQSGSSPPLGKAVTSTLTAMNFVEGTTSASSNSDQSNIVQSIAHTNVDTV